MEKERIVVEDVLISLGITAIVRNVFLEKTDSPWNEKILVKRKKDHLDAKITVWDDNLYLYGRIYRLLLYVRDVLDRPFNYDPQKAPKEDGDPSLWELYAQIWGIYVDSRMERKNIANFYNRQVRRNLFVDARKDLTWEEGFLLFDKLWEKASYTHPEVVSFAHNLDSLLRTDPALASADNFEVEVQEFLKDHSVRKHIDKVPSHSLQQMIHEILNYTAYHCKGTIIYSAYFGICFGLNLRTYAELITTKENSLLLTLVDFLNGKQTTHQVTESSDLGAFQREIKATYDTIHRLESVG
jgi:hypothetical protein